MPPHTYLPPQPGSYMDVKDPVLQQHGYLYESDGYYDELAFAAAMLYKATGALPGSCGLPVWGPPAAAPACA